MQSNIQTIGSEGRLHDGQKWRSFDENLVNMHRNKQLKDWFDRIKSRNNLQESIAGVFNLNSGRLPTISVQVGASKPRGIINAYVNTCQRWGLNLDNQLILLGLSSDSLIGKNVLGGKMGLFSKDVEQRARYIVGISLGLGTLFRENKSAEIDWLSIPRANLNDQSPLSYMLEGDMSNLYTIVEMVLYERGIWNLLDCDVFKEEHKSVLRLAAVSGNTSKSMLLKRGVDIEDVEDAATVLGNLPLPLTAEELIEGAFRPQDQRATPFPVKHFGDGTIGVYYSALEKVTCKKELAFHLNTSFIEMHEKNFSYERVYSLVECNYSGTTVDLRGQEINNPDLVSVTEAGYPFYQRLALKAVKRRITGFYTASARHDGGTCVPVFARSALSNPSIRCEVTLQVTVAGAEFHSKNLPI